MGEGGAEAEAVAVTEGGASAAAAAAAARLTPFNTSRDAVSPLSHICIQVSN